jgi:ribose transport system substrate-binding protein
MSRKTLINLFIAAVLVLSVLLTACQPAAAPPAATEAPGGEATEAPAAGEAIPVVIGWTPPDITGGFKTATDFFQASADDANQNGFDVQLITQSVTSHTNFADQVAIIEDYVQRGVDVIAISPIEVEVIKPALAKAAEAGIPVIIVNLLEPIEGAKVDAYIGFDNSVAAEVSAYSLLDYFGGPGVLGSGEKVEIAPEDYLDIEFWENLYSGLSDEEKAQIQASGAIIEGVAGGFFSQARLNASTRWSTSTRHPDLGNPCAADWNRRKASNARRTSCRRTRPAWISSGRFERDGPGRHALASEQLTGWKSLARPPRLAMRPLPCSPTT